MHVFLERFTLVFLERFTPVFFPSFPSPDTLCPDLKRCPGLVDNHIRFQSCSQWIIFVDIDFPPTLCLLQMFCYQHYCIIPFGWEQKSARRLHAAIPTSMQHRSSRYKDKSKRQRPTLFHLALVTGLTTFLPQVEVVVVGVSTKTHLHREREQCYILLRAALAALSSLLLA